MKLFFSLATFIIVVGGLLALFGFIGAATIATGVWLSQGAIYVPLTFGQLWWWSGVGAAFVGAQRSAWVVVSFLAED